MPAQMSLSMIFGAPERIDQVHRAKCIVATAVAVAAAAAAHYGCRRERS